PSEDRSLPKVLPIPNTQARPTGSGYPDTFQALQLCQGLQDHREDHLNKLKKEPVGTFLIRDSRQSDVFFTLSYTAQIPAAAVPQTDY
uniref:SH2 domain-containing protein n=1 Tax=Cyprinus carpio TaxID=7962 RepID=A0A8C2JL22_CYPCA